MAELKLVINDTKTGKSYQKVLPDNPFLNLKIGDKVNGTTIGMEGYELELAGGSDSSGFPMRWDVSGVNRKRVLLTEGPGLRTVGAPRGFRKKKSVAPNTVSALTAQINFKVLTYGTKTVPESLGIQPKEEAPKAETKA